MIKNFLLMVWLASVITVVPVLCYAEKHDVPLRTLRLTHATPPDSFDVLRTEFAQTAEFMSLVSLGLKALSSVDARWDLLESYEMAEDGLSYILTLKDGVPWSDGVLMSARDLQAAILYQTGKDTSAISKSLYPFVSMEKSEGDAEPAAKVEVLDRLRLKVYLKAPDPFFIERLANSRATLLRADLYKKYGEKWHLPDNLVTLSPFKVENNQLPKQISLVKIPEFPGAGSIFWDRIEVNYIEENSRQLSELKEDNTDFIYYADADSGPEKSERLPGRWIPDSGLPYSYYLLLHPGKAVFADKRLRKAIRLLADRYTLTKWEANIERPLEFIIPPGLHEPYRSYSITGRIPTLAEREENFAEAGKLLRDMGITPETPLNLKYRVPDVGSFKRSAIRLQRIAQRYGLNFELLVEPSDAHYPKFFAGDYDLASIVWGAMNHGNPLQQLIPFNEESFFAGHGYDHPQYFETLKEIDQQTTKDAVYKLLETAENLLLEDGFVMPMSVAYEGRLVGERIGVPDGKVSEYLWMLRPSQALLQQAGDLGERAEAVK